MTVLCPVPGCDAHVADARAAEMRAHASKRHDRCLCGWVGVSLGGHLRRLPRKGTHWAFGRAPDDGRIHHGLDAGEDDLMRDVGSPGRERQPGRRQDPWEPCGP